MGHTRAPCDRDGLHGFARRVAAYGDERVWRGGVDERRAVRSSRRAGRPWLGGLGRRTRRRSRGWPRWRAVTDKIDAAACWPELSPWLVHLATVRPHAGRDDRLAAGSRSATPARCPGQDTSALGRAVASRARRTWVIRDLLARYDAGGRAEPSQCQELRRLRRTSLETVAGKVPSTITTLKTDSASLERASKLAPVEVRALDAIHLDAALQLHARGAVPGSPHLR